ncbi:hypothetical protein TomTYG75_06900 [Sphingobium sp. TomTYG75]
MDMELIRQRMAEMGLKQGDVARALGIDASAVSKLLTGKRALKANEAQVLAMLLHIDAIGSPVIRTLPVIGQASAGAWQEAIEQPLSHMPCPDPMVPAEAFVVLVDGDSIDLIAPNGAHIIVDPTDLDLVERGLYLMRNGNGESTVKVFRSNPARLEPCSSNPAHNVIHLGRDHVQVIGRIIWKAEKLR